MGLFTGAVDEKALSINPKLKLNPKLNPKPNHKLKLHPEHKLKLYLPFATLWSIATKEGGKKNPPFSKVAKKILLGGRKNFSPLFFTAIYNSNKMPTC